MNSKTHPGPWKGAKLRKGMPTGIVIHAMSQRLEGKHAPDWLSAYGLSVHAMIEPDGTIIHCVPATNTAWHAGASKHLGLNGLNEHYLGVELLVKGEHSYAGFLKEINKKGVYTRAQYESLAALSKDWMNAYPTIKVPRIVGHSQVSGDEVRGPGLGKRDPGLGFDWMQFRALL